MPARRALGSGWAPLRSLDTGAAETFNRVDAAHPELVTAAEVVSDVFDPNVFRVGLTVVAVVYVIRGERHHATWLVVTVFGGAALALYAAVAFLDESVLNSAQPMFASWPSRPLQEEIFGGHMGGEIFFQHLRQLLAAQDSEDLADVLEVFQLCLLMGFQGRYSTTDRGELRGLSTAAGEKIHRIRGSFGELSPAWALPTGETVPRARDPWLPFLLVLAVSTFVGVWLLFGWFRTTLDSRNIQFRAVAQSVR